MKKSRKRIWLLIGAVTALVLVLGITAAFAQVGEETAAPDVAQEEEPADTSPFSGRFGRHFSHPERRPGAGRLLEGITPRGELLADALGIELEELIESQLAAQAAWLGEMVANGYMEQDQADLMLAYQALKGNIDRHAIMATVLGLSQAELTAARQEGKSLSILLEEQGLTVEEFTAALESAYRDGVQALVPDVLTQEQADQILENGSGVHGFGDGPRGFGQNRPRSGSGLHGPGANGRGMQGFGGGMHGSGAGAGSFNGFGFSGSS